MSLALIALIAGCSGDGGADTAPAETSDDGGCGCEAPGDADDLPDVLGFWTINFASKLFDENCGLSGLSQNSETWLQGAAMEIDGRVPDTIYATIGDEEFWGAMSNGGGITLEGWHESEHGPMHVAIGGLVYYEAYQYQRSVIEGWAFLGLDTFGDGEIDCGARGDLTGILSGR